MSNEPNPQLSGRPYANYFSVLRELTNTGENILKFCRNNLLHLLDEKRGKHINILSVGYGTGIIETDVLTHLKPHFARIRFDGVEPNEVHEQQFHTRLDAPHPLHFSLMECVRSNGFDIHTSTVSLEQFEPEDGVTYDLILLSHVLYYPADRAAALHRVLSFLSPSGVMIIFQQTPAGLNEIQRLFSAEMSMPPHYYSSVEAQTVLQTEGIDYQTTLFDQTLDVTDVLRGETLSEIPHRGMALISFLCERDLGSLRETAPSSIDWPALQRLRDFIRRTSFTQADNRRVIFYPTAAIVAKRHSSALNQSSAAFAALTAHPLPARTRPWAEFRDLDLETIVIRSALLPDMLRLRAENHGSDTIIEFEHEDNGMRVAVSASKFYKAVQFLAFGLHQAGVKTKDRVAILSAPSPSSLVLISALWHLGAIVVPLALALPLKAFQEQLGICRASLLLVSDAWATVHPEAVVALQAASGNRWRMGLFDQSSPSPKPHWADLAPLRAVSFDIDLPAQVGLADCALHADDLAAVLFSSGTTGSPKAVPLTHLNILFSAHSRNALWPSLVNNETRVLGWMPLCHVMGLVVEWATTALYSGGTYLLPSASVSAMPTPSGLLSLAASTRATTLSCVPWMLGQWRLLATTDAASLATLRGLKYILYGGAPMERNDVEWYRQQGVRLQQGMGMTEVGTLFVAPEDPNVPIDELSPLPGFHYKLRRPTNQTARFDSNKLEDEPTTGEVLAKSLSITRGYLNRLEGEGFSSDGYYCTGDLFVRLPNGRYRFECRLDDLLVLSTGEKLNPVLIETQIRELAAPNVAQVCLISGPVLPVAVIEPNWAVAGDQVTLQQMQAKIWDVVTRVNEMLASWARLQRQSVWVLDRHEAPLPTTRKHVIDRPVVRKRFESALEATPHHKSVKISDSVSGHDSGKLPVTNEKQATRVAEVSTMVEDILAIRLRPGDVNRSLIELGLSSFFAIQLAVSMKQRWPQLTTEAVLSSPTITDLVRLAMLAERDNGSLLTAEALTAPPRSSESLLYWFTRKPLARVRLLLVNDMGGTATDFAQFDRLSSQEIEIVALNLPGHRGRPKSAYLKDIPALTDAFTREAAPYLADRPFVIYGQCMGGHVAYELALALQNQSSLRLKGIAVGGCPAPLSSAAFKRSVAGNEPTEAEIRELLEGPAAAGSGGSPEKHTMLLNALYDWYSKDMIADHAMFTATLQRYLDPAAPAPGKLTVPLIACFGRKDDTITADEVVGWHSVATADFEFKVLPEGSHALFAEAPFIRWLQARVLSL